MIYILGIMSTTQYPTSTYPLGYMNGSLPNLQQHNGSIPSTYAYQNGIHMTSGSNGNTFGFRKRMERIDWKKIGNILQIIIVKLETSLMLAIFGK